MQQTIGHGRSAELRCLFGNKQRSQAGCAWLKFWALKKSQAVVTPCLCTHQKRMKIQNRTSSTWRAVIGHLWLLPSLFQSCWSSRCFSPCFGMHLSLYVYIYITELPVPHCLTHPTSDCELFSMLHMCPWSDDVLHFGTAINSPRRFDDPRT